MAAADRQTGLHRHEPGGEESLANALSAFLSQLHAGFDDAHIAEPGDQAPVVTGRDVLEMAPVSRLSPVGALDSRLPRRLISSIGANGTPADRVLGNQRPKATELAARPLAPPAPHRLEANAWAPDPLVHRAGAHDTRPPATATATAAAAAAAAAADDAPRKRRFGRSAEALTVGAVAAIPVARPGTPPITVVRPGAPAIPIGGPTTQAITVARPGTATVARTAPRGGRGTTVAALVLAVGLAAGLAVSLDWGHNKATALTTKAHQLALADNNLGATQSGMGAAEARIARQLDDIRSLHAMYSADRAQLAANGAQLTATKSELAKVQAQLSQAQAQLSEAQGRVGQAQSQLRDTEANLSASEAHAAQCQQGASLGQQMFQLEGAFILLENGYLTAVQAKDSPQMQQDLAQMQSLDTQAQGIGAELTAAVGTCTHAG